MGYCLKQLTIFTNYCNWLLQICLYLCIITPPPPPAADSCSRNNFWTTFWISFIFGTIVGPDLQITWLDFGRFSSRPWPRFFKVNYGICYISAKNGPITTKTKSKHIDWTLGLKCDHWVWPWPWPWPRFFKVKYGICYISAKNDPIATKRKANISIELYGSNVTIRFDLGHDLDLEFSRSIYDHDHLVTKVRCMDLPDSYRGDFSCRCAVDSSSYPGQRITGEPTYYEMGFH